MIVPLTRILVDGAAQQPVAFSGSLHYTRSDWHAAVAALLPVLQASPAQHWLLTHNDSWLFSIGLFTLLAAGKQVILPGNALPGTLAALQDQADALLGEGASTLPHLAIHGHPAASPAASLPVIDKTGAITLFTSGSTGHPKQVRKTLAGLEAEILALENLWGERAGDAAVLSTVSHQHLYGLIFRLLWPLSAGRPFAATTIQYPEMLMAEVNRLPRALLVSSPSQLARFAPSAGNPGPVVVFSSGAPLPADAADAWRQSLGEAPIEVLGSTETGGVAWRQQAAGETLWRPLPGVAVRCDNDNHLLVQSPFTGEQDAIPLGDRGQLLEGGLFRLAGRTDRIVKIEGKRLSLEQMEQQLLATGLAAAARVVILPGGRPGAVVVPSAAGESLLSAEGKLALGMHLRDALAPHFERVQLPRKWRFPAGLPRNSLGKTTHSELLDLFQPGSTPSSGEVHVQMQSSTEDSVVLQMAFPVGATVFDGHFPGLPILPGVVQFDLAVRQCERWYPLTAFRQIGKLKFQEPIVPGDQVTLTLQHLGAGQVQFSFRLGDRPLSSGRVVFAT